MNTEKILNEFYPLCDIPRPSQHEEKVSEYIVNRLKEIGLDPIRDAFNNVIVEKPATDGRENEAITILQAHMDMVCVAADDYPEYDPLTTPIKVKRDGNTLTGEKTSLGGDDGIGVAMILAILSEDFPHGPIRAIFTADEEVGMSGAANLDSHALKAKYLINLDWDEMGSICVCCGGGISMTYTKNIEYEDVTSGVAYVLRVSGLLGGHSGTEVQKRRASAIKVLGFFAGNLSRANFSYRIADIHGGVAANVIASSAEMVMVVSEDDEETFNEYFAQFKAALEEYKEFEPKMLLEFNKVELPGSAATEKDSADIGGLLYAYLQGVEAMSPHYRGIVETSSNMGTISMGEQVIIEALSRTNNTLRMKTLFPQFKDQAEKFGFELTQDSVYPLWASDRNSKIGPLAGKCWEKRHNGEPMKVVLLHAGLECGYFAEKNPSLDMISVGPDMSDAHSVDETIFIDTLEPTALLVMDLLTALSE